MKKTLNEFVDEQGRLVMRDQTFLNMSWDSDKEPPELSKILLENVFGKIDFGGAKVANFEEIPVQINGGSGSVDNLMVWTNFDIWGVDVRGAFKLNNITVDDARIGVLLRHMDSGLYDSHIYDCSEDHVRVMSGSTEVIGNTLSEHTYEYSPEVHKDLIQVVAANYGASSDQLVDNPIMNVVIKGNHCSSRHHESQGIMVSDGVLIDSIIEGNFVSVETTHCITLNRGHNVRIDGNDCDRINIGSAKLTSAENMGIVVAGNSCRLLSIYPNSEVDHSRQLQGEIYSVL